MIFRRLGISTPDAAVVNISPDFIRDNPEVHIQYGSRAEHLSLRFPFRLAFSRVRTR